MKPDARSCRCDRCRSRRGRAGASGRWIREAAANSLRRLQTDHIDLYQLHVPDDTVPIEETLGAFDELVQRGDVLAIGASNFSPAQIDEAAEVADAGGLTRFVSVQNRYSVLTRDPEWGGVLDACARNGCAFLPYFPLESGLLTGKYTAASPPPPGSRLSGDNRPERFLNDRFVELAGQLEAYAQERGRALRHPRRDRLRLLGNCEHLASYGQKSRPMTSGRMGPDAGSCRSRRARWRSGAPAPR